MKVTNPIKIYCILKNFLLKVKEKINLKESIFVELQDHSFFLNNLNIFFTNELFEYNIMCMEVDRIKTPACCLIKLTLFIFLASIPILIYFQGYIYKDCDDKAVHYFCSAMTFSSKASRKIIQDNLGAWTGQLEKSFKKDRLTGRIQGWYTYPAMSTLIGVHRYISNPNKQSKTVEYGTYFKRSSLTLLLFSLMYLLFIGHKTTFSIWPILIILNLVSFKAFDIPFLADMPRPVFHPIIQHAPRSSATLFAVAILLCMSSKEYRWATFSMFLFFLWHVGFAAMVLPVFSITILIYLLFCHLVHQTKFKSKNYLTARLLLLTIIFLISSKTVGYLSQLSMVKDFLAQIITPLAIKEIPDRLASVNYIFAAALIVIPMWIIWENYLNPFLQEKQFRLAIYSGIILLFIVGATHLVQNSKELNSFTTSKNLAYFQSDCPGIDRLVLNTVDLKLLNPKNEMHFFVYLGEYLFANINKPK